MTGRALAVAVALAVGCGAGSDAAEPSSPGQGDAGAPGASIGDASPDGQADPDAAPDGSLGSTIESPVPQSFADPFVLHDGAYELYATQARGKHFPHVTSKDLSSWDTAHESDAMPSVPAWAASDGAFWAPGVLEVSATRYVMFYAAKVAGSAPSGERGHICIGRAVSASPAGPFVDSHPEPLVCLQRVWSIDPSPFADADGSFGLVWRQDVATPSGPTNAVYEQPLSADGEDFRAGSHPTELIRRTDGTWEGNIVENPAMVVVGGKHFLFYSANSWQTADYAIGLADCASASGPCTKVSTTTAWFASATSTTTALRGPGGEEVIRGSKGVAELSSDGAATMTMHGWIAPNVGPGTGGLRALWLMPLRFDGSSPALDAP